MKSCPTCGARAGDNDTYCKVDGSKLATRPSDEVTPDGVFLGQGGEWSGVCASCDAIDSDDGEGYCARCGHLLDSRRSTLPGSIPTKIGEYTIVRGHGEGDFLATDDAGRPCLLALGPKELLAEEVNALLAQPASSTFPTVLSQNQDAGLGLYVALSADLEGWLPLGKAKLSLAGGMQTLRALLSAAEALEARGFSWEPRASDIYVNQAGDIRVTRARGARRLLEREALNAKRVLEVAGGTLLPAPLAAATPSLVRLALPHFNFSTVAKCSVREAREEIERAHAVLGRPLPSPALSMAELCDPGLRRNHNEDATAIADGVLYGEPYTVLVVCDGVSSSTHAEQASAIAATVARDSLAQFARSGDILKEGASSALLSAIRAAHLAICSSNIEHGDGPPPGTTIVAALVFRSHLTVGWVGDSRAYWVSDQGSELCTTDHSWVNEAVARGEATEAEAMASPMAHALTKCLGPLESSDGTFHDIDPGVRTKVLKGPGHLILCTDGLWNYFPTASAVTSLVRSAGTDADPEAIARYLVCRALAHGGGDNVSVAIHAVT